MRKKNKSGAPLVNKSKVLDLKEELKLSDEDAEVLRTYEQEILKAKLKFADIELSIIKLNNEKKSLFDFINFQQAEFVTNAKKIAIKNGIDPDGDPSKERWNLNTSTMTFNKIKE